MSLEGFPGSPPIIVKGWNIKVDQLEELAINKVCAVVGRGEIRDLEDLAYIASLGTDLEAALLGASSKDSGVGPDTLLISLQSYTSSLLPETLEKFRQEWIEKLKVELYPAE